MPSPLVANAPAKINLTLRVLGRRSDGYHDIESLVVFARVGDRLTFARDQAEWNPVSRTQVGYSRLGRYISADLGYTRDRYHALNHKVGARTADKFTQSAQARLLSAKPVPTPDQVRGRLFADRALARGAKFALAMRGPTAALAGDTGDNLVLKAARALSGRVKSLREGRFVLTKLLPVAAGLGGGSSDAAAALRLLARANKLLPGDPRLFAAARATGADVPVCLDPRPRVMRGIGDVLSEPLDLPQLPAVLVNPGVAVATKDVFIALARKPGELMAAASLDPAIIPRKRDELIAFLARQVNDLEPAAIKVEPTIGKVLAALRALPGCRLARMSGSGATCFALFDTNAAAISGARQLREKQSGWWIRATVLGAAAE